MYTTMCVVLMCSVTANINLTVTVASKSRIGPKHIKGFTTPPPPSQFHIPRLGIIEASLTFHDYLNITLLGNTAKMNLKINLLNNRRFLVINYLCSLNDPFIKFKRTIMVKVQLRSM